MLEETFRNNVDAVVTNCGKLVPRDLLAETSAKVACVAWCTYFRKDGSSAVKFSSTNHGRVIWLGHFDAPVATRLTRLWPSYFVYLYSKMARFHLRT
jgi:hypothetical protein